MWQVAAANSYRDVWTDTLRRVRPPVTATPRGGDRPPRWMGRRSVARVPMVRRPPRSIAWVSTPLPRETSGPGIPTSTRQSRFLKMEVEAFWVSIRCGGSRYFVAASAVKAHCPLPCLERQDEEKWLSARPCVTSTRLNRSRGSGDWAPLGALSVTRSRCLAWRHLAQGTFDHPGKSFSIRSEEFVATQVLGNECQAAAVRSSRGGGRVVSLWSARDF